MMYITEKNIMRYLYLALIAIVLSSCGASRNTPNMATLTVENYQSAENYPIFLDITEKATDDTYGLTGDNPVKVGGVENREGPLNQRRYLASLAGPNGEVLKFKRLGSCCGYESDGSPFGTALVDIYEVTYNGLKKPINIYISLYDLEPLYIPKGFTKAN